MNRRDFQTGLMLSGLSAASPALASNKEESGRDRISDYARVHLRLAAASIVLTWFIVHTRNGFLGLDLRQPVPRFDENRVNVGRIPILGQLTRALLAQRFAGANAMGQLVLLGTYLILLPTITQSLTGKSVVIANRDQSWEPPGRLRPVKLREFPTIGQLMQQEKVGTAHLKNDELLILVKPSIVQLDES